jgi:hypothetical protein
MPSPTVARDDLLFLWHPDTPCVISGFGLAIQADLLIGLLMIDRPHLVSEDWLDEIESTFGGYELYALTATHERGIACQMRVKADSLSYVRSLDTPLAQLLRQALMPLLAQPPQPRFVMQWDPGQHLWTSKFDLSSAKAPTKKQPLFSLGQVVATPGALDALQSADQTPFEFLGRHAAGDWGDLCEEDRHENERALKCGNRLFSAYKLSDGTKLWVITEWDRSVTTLLLPSEY